MKKMTYRIRLRDRFAEIHILDVSFSQLCEHYLHSGARLPKDFWKGKVSVEGPMGNVKLLS